MLTVDTDSVRWKTSTTSSPSTQTHLTNRLREKKDVLGHRNLSFGISSSVYPLRDYFSTEVQWSATLCGRLSYIAI
jgi:hypothetical protein